MLDVSSIANAIKSVQPPPLQAQPSVAEEMKPVPQAEIQDAVPPPSPPKGGEPGLGEHLDLYDTETSRNPVPAKEAKPEDASSQHAATEAPPAELTPDQPKADAPKKEKPKPKTELLGDKTGLPQPSTDPIHLDLPFLKPLGQEFLGKSLDARI